MRTVTADVLTKIMQWEGFCGTAYDDATGKPPVGAVRGTLTIGYGHTGPDVKPGDAVTKEQATQLLRLDLAKAERAVETNVKVDLTDSQFGALVSFVFNVGVNAFKTSTLLKKLNAGNYAAVPTELARWNKTTVSGKKVVSQGLANRRAAEAGLWATGSFVTSAGQPATPATPAAVSKETVSWGVGLLGSLGSVFVGSGPIQYALAAVIVIGVAVGAYSFIQNRRSR